MISFRYETHAIQNPFLPFIFHPSFKIKKRINVPNYHTSVEILQCIKGEGFVRCEKTLFPLNRDTLVVVNSDVLHSVGTEGELEYRCLILDDDFLRSNGIPLNDLVFSSLLEDPLVISAFNTACEAFLRLDSDDFRSVVRLRSDVMNLCALLCDFSTPKPTAAKENDYVKQAITYIRQHLSEPITLELLSRQVGISPFHLARLFKHDTGSTIIQSVNQMRCVEALHLLEQGISVSEVADTCGFSNHSYFSKTFKNIMGKLPSEV